MFFQQSLHRCPDNPKESVTAETTQTSTVPDEVYYMQPGDEVISVDQVMFGVQGTPNLMTVLRGEFCNSGVSAAIVNSGSAGDGISVQPATVNLRPTIAAVPVGHSLGGDGITVDTTGNIANASEKVVVSDGVPSPETPSPATWHPRGTHRPSSYKYLLELAVVDGAGMAASRLADCVRELVAFAYCGPLAITEERYPVLHDLAKLLQMDEAISLCEKHAVDQLVGSSPEPPPPTAEPQPGPSRPVGGESARLQVCRSCSFACHGAARMREHRRMHHVRSYMCGFCGVTRQKTSQLLHHLIEAEHGESVCSLCFHECGPGESMADHYLRHNDPRPFFCSVCFARFPSRDRAQPAHADPLQRQAVRVPHVRPRLQVAARAAESRAHARHREEAALRRVRLLYAPHGPVQGAQSTSRGRHRAVSA